MQVRVVSMYVGKCNVALSVDFETAMAECTDELCFQSDNDARWKQTQSVPGDCWLFHIMCGSITA